MSESLKSVDWSHAHCTMHSHIVLLQVVVNHARIQHIALLTHQTVLSTLINLSHSFVNVFTRTVQLHGNQIIMPYILLVGQNTLSM